MQSKMLRLLSAVLLGLTTGPGHAVIINFDSLAVGSPVTTIDGVEFTASNPDYGPLNLVVSDQFATTSGDRYLGTSDSFFDAFLPLDVIRLVFDQPIISLAVSFISSPNTPGGVFGIDTAAGSVASGAAPDDFLVDDGEVFQLAFSSAVPFDSAELVSLLPDLYSFNIDDIAFTRAGAVTAPEPASLALFALALPLLGWMRRRCSVR